MVASSEQNLGVETPTNEDTRDVYGCYDAQELELAVQVLSAQGFDVLVRDSASSTFPLHVGLQDWQILAVAAHRAAEARAHLAAAVEDGVIGASGAVVAGDGSE
jgi:hypothetical protein